MDEVIFILKMSVTQIASLYVDQEETPERPWLPP